MAFICTFFAINAQSWAASFQLPPTPGDAVIIQHPDFPSAVALTKARQDETLLDIARRFLLGQNEIVRLNPDVDRWLVRKGTIVRLPNKRVLPDTPRRGITLNLSEFRMYVYPPDQPGTVLSFAHGIGRQDWNTPLGQTRIVHKVKDPYWYPPESIRREHAARGEPLPAVVPPGPNNPMGAFSLHLGLTSGEYRIHGTDIDKIYGIGMQITHGCVRMYPENIEQLFHLTPVGTPVFIVKQPIKVGWLDNVLYIEAHPDLEGENTSVDSRYAAALELISRANNDELPNFDQRALNEALEKLDGIPRPIYERLPPLDGEWPPIQAAAPALLPVAAAQLNKPKPAASRPAIGRPATSQPIIGRPQANLSKPIIGKPGIGKPGGQASPKATPKTGLARPATPPPKPKPGLTSLKAQQPAAPSAKKPPPKRQGSPGGYYRGG